MGWTRTRREVGGEAKNRPRGTKGSGSPGLKEFLSLSRISLLKSRQRARSSVSWYCAWFHFDAWLVLLGRNGVISALHVLAVASVQGLCVPRSTPDRNLRGLQLLMPSRAATRIRPDNDTQIAFYTLHCVFNRGRGG
jgi:hypothetical protein